MDDFQSRVEAHNQKGIQLMEAWAPYTFFMVMYAWTGPFAPFFAHMTCQMIGKIPR